MKQAVLMQASCLQTWTNVSRSRKELTISACILHVEFKNINLFYEMKCN